MARHLAAQNRVTLVSTSSVSATPEGVMGLAINAGDESRMRGVVSRADVVVVQGYALAQFRCLGAGRARLVVDAYAPMPLELLARRGKSRDGEARRAVALAARVMTDQLRIADFVMCASERQRQFYLGQLMALGRVNVATYAQDPDLRRLIDVVPFGLEEAAPVRAGTPLRDAMGAVSPETRVALWGGGLYDWFDPVTLVRAMAELKPRRPEARLVFQAGRHPSSSVPEMEAARAARDEAHALGVLDSSVFFYDTWVPLADRGSFLLDADAGVSTHSQHLETTFAFRTRILDYLWAGLPMVVTAGDAFADLVDRERLGVVVEPSDISGLAAALEKVLFDRDFADECATNIAQLRSAYAWPTVLEPLLDFCAHGMPAADLPRDRAARIQRSLGLGRFARTRTTGLGYVVRRAFAVLKDEGFSSVARRVSERLAR